MSLNDEISKIKVLSLFDGISCGMVALERAGIEVDRYVAYEIDKYAIQVSNKNYPQIEHCGDVTTADYTQYKGFDLLIGGSPCTYWSIAKNNRETTPDGIGGQLFMHYVRALKESNCKYFLYENNFSIHQNIKDFITAQLGVQPIMIDSALVSAQNRKRFYWTNIPNVTQPKDKKINIKNIYIPDPSLERIDDRIEKTARRCKNYIQYSVNDKYSTSHPYRLYFMDGKAPAQARCRTESKCKILIDETNINKYKIICPTECERMQTLPDGYTDVGIPKTTRFELIGNGWTVDVIVHILNSIFNKTGSRTKIK